MPIIYMTYKNNLLPRLPGTLHNALKCAKNTRRNPITSGCVRTSKVGGGGTGGKGHVYMCVCVYVCMCVCVCVYVCMYVCRCRYRYVGIGM